MRGERLSNKGGPKTRLKRNVIRFDSEVAGGKYDLDRRAPISAADLHEAAEIGHPLANAAETHARGSALIPTLRFREGHALALVLDLEPDLIIAQR